MSLLGIRQLYCEVPPSAQPAHQGLKEWQRQFEGRVSVLLRILSSVSFHQASMLAGGRAGGSLQRAVGFADGRRAAVWGVCGHQGKRTLGWYASGALHMIRSPFIAFSPRMARATGGGVL